MKDESKKRVIPGKVLAALVNGDKVRCYRKDWTCSGVVWWDGYRLRYSRKSDLT